MEYEIDWSMLQWCCKHYRDDFYECYANPELPEKKCKPEVCPIIERGINDD